MPPSVDSPVQTRIPIPVPDGILGNGKNGSAGLQTRPVGRRRIFVQTDTGSVLGIELDRADSAQTVKKKMQAMLNVPIEQTALVFGGTIIKGDLSELRNDSPLLLTRELQRSLSTPCIFPSPDLQVSMDGGQPFEVVGGVRCCSKMKRILKEMNKAINCGVEPVAVSGGLGGAYYFRNTNGDSVAIVKPTDEEPFAPNNPKGYIGRSLGQPGLKKTVRVGETGVREVAAYLLDHENFAKVPPTVLVKVAHHAFHVNGASSVHKGHAKVNWPVAKIASCQQFVHHDYDASDHGTSRFSVAAVHRIGILDVRIFNTDRHAGNILIRSVNSSFDRTWSCSNVHVNESLELIPIDHGLCLPEALEDPYFEWLHWPQASVPFSEEELDYIRRLDEYRDVDMLRCELPMLREACFRMLILCTTVLKRAAAAGFCLAEIGEMMSRDGIEEASQLELLCMQAKLEVDDELLAEKPGCDDDDEYDDAALSEVSAGEDLHEQFHFEMDHDWDHKFSGVIGEPQLFSKETDRVSSFTSGFPFLPISLAPAHDFSFSPKALHSKGRVPLQIWPEISALEEEDELSSPCKVSAGGPSPWNARSGAPQKLTLDTKSPRSARAVRSPRLCTEFCPLIEEEEVLVFADNDVRKALQEADFLSPRAMSLRSVSFHNRKQSYSDRGERKTPASETTGKVNVNGGSPPFSPGDMSEEEWSLFMDRFEGVLEEVLANRQERSVSHRQRLGISCQF